MTLYALKWLVLVGFRFFYFIFDNFTHIDSVSWSRPPLSCSFGSSVAILYFEAISMFHSSRIYTMQCPSSLVLASCSACIYLKYSSPAFVLVFIACVFCYVLISPAFFLCFILFFSSSWNSLCRPSWPWTHRFPPAWIKGVPTTALPSCSFCLQWVPTHRKSCLVYVYSVCSHQHLVPVADDKPVVSHTVVLS